MRVWLLLAIFLLPAVTAEYGPLDDGFPVGEGGTSHHPMDVFAPEALATWALEYPPGPGVMTLSAGDPLNQVAGNTVYPYYPLLVAELQRLAMDHPDRVQLVSAGKSLAGLDLWMLEIRDFDNPDAVPTSEREVVWIDGGTHSNEYSGAYFVLAVAQYLIEGYGSDEFATWVVENRHTWIMPMVNPDGSHAMGRLNAAGVNINRNYPVIWGGAGTDATLNNPGPYAGSEPETQINIEWFNKTMPDYYASIHCCGNLWLFPYGEDGYDPLDVDMMNRVCDEAFPPEIRLDCGPIWSTIYPASGSSVDTAYEYTGAVSFGFEMSGRSNLVGPWGEPITAEEVFAQEAESWQGVQHAFENVHLYGAYLNITDIQADTTGLTVSVTNSGLGNLTTGTLEYSRHFPDDNNPIHTSIITYDAVALPHMEPNQTVQVFLSGTTDSGDAQLDLHYAKRIMVETYRDSVTPLSVVPGAAVAFADGVWTVPTNPDTENSQSITTEIPAAPVAVVLLGLFLLARRR